MVSPFKNVNPYWVGASALAIWFLFIYAPPLLKSRSVDAAFGGHLVGAYTIYLACMHNTLITPSIAKQAHVWIGRLGMIMGSMGFVLGLYISWWPWRVQLPPMGFAIGITIGGLAQIKLQIEGYIAIRKFQRLRDQLEALQAAAAAATTRTGGSAKEPSEKSNRLSNETDRLIATSPETVKSLEEQKSKALKVHIASMISLFVLACGVPAGMRVAGLLGGDGPTAILVAIGLLTVVAEWYTKWFLSRLGPT